MLVVGMKLKAFSVHKGRTSSATCSGCFVWSRGARQGFRYKGIWEEKVVNEDFEGQHAVDENELEQNVTLVAGVPESVAGLATPAAHAATPVATPAPATRGFQLPADRGLIEFPCSSANTVLQVRPVVIYVQRLCVLLSEQHTCGGVRRTQPLSVQLPKRVFYSTVLDFALSSPTALKVHLKGDVIETTSSLAVDKWQHVVLSWTSRDGMLTLYIDGAKCFHRRS